MLSQVCSAFPVVSPNVLQKKILAALWKSKWWVGKKIKLKTNILWLLKGTKPDPGDSMLWSFRAFLSKLSAKAKLTFAKERLVVCVSLTAGVVPVSLWLEQNRRQCPSFTLEARKHSLWMQLFYLVERTHLFPPWEVYYWGIRLEHPALCLSLHLIIFVVLGRFCNWSNMTSALGLWKALVRGLQWGLSYAV